jgi:hypothetical protein
MHADSMDIDAAIAEFELVVKALFAGPRRDIEVMKSKIKHRVRDHESRNRLQRELELMVARELRRECV